MAFQRPTLTQLIERAQADIESRLPGTDPRARRTVIGILARLHADAVHSLYGHQDWIARQILPDTAEAEILDRHASFRGLTRIAAVAASGNVTFTGTNGVAIPAGTELQSAAGERYTTDAEVTIAGGSATAAVTAAVAGDEGNQPSGAQLSLTSPIAGVTSQATVASPGLAGGADAESDDALRERLLRAYRETPHGGAAADYIAWARAAHPDVTHAWVYPSALGLGTVTVRIMTYGATASGIPTQTVIDAVQAYIDARRPVTADLTVVAPVAVALNFTIQSLSPNTQAVRDAIAAELADLLRREAEPGGTILLSRIREVISAAEDEYDHVLVSPAANVTHTTGQIAVMGVITWS